MILRPLLVSLLLCATNVPLLAQGIFANIDTNLGRIRVKLDYNRAPLTVANFVGLVEGSQPAIDPRNGRAVEGRFYDGMIFHRVIKDFMIQTGSPAGTGADGPGYVIRDEFHPKLRHDAFVISMANSGPNTNGSQFFITVKPTPWLDDIHSVFGEVVEGEDVALKISLVPTTSDRPKDPVRIDTVRIERIDSDAQEFAVKDIGLPTVGYLPVSPMFRDGALNLAGDFAMNRVYTLYVSSDLKKWTSQDFPVLTDKPLAFTDVSSFAKASPRHFFRVTETRYTEFLTASAMSGKVLRMKVTEFNGGATDSKMSLAFDKAEGGVITLESLSSRVNEYLYEVIGPAKATLIVPSKLPSPFQLIQFSLRFVDKTKGNFVARMPSSSPAGLIAGDFTLE